MQSKGHFNEEMVQSINFYMANSNNYDKYLENNFKSVFHKEINLQDSSIHLYIFPLKNCSRPLARFPVNSQISF